MATWCHVVGTVLDRKWYFDRSCGDISQARKKAFINEYILIVCAARAHKAPKFRHDAKTTGGHLDSHISVILGNW